MAKIYISRSTVNQLVYKSPYDCNRRRGAVGYLGYKELFTFIRYTEGVIEIRYRNGGYPYGYIPTNTFLKSYAFGGLYRFGRGTYGTKSGGTISGDRYAIRKGEYLIIDDGAYSYRRYFGKGGGVITDRLSDAQGDGSVYSGRMWASGYNETGGKFETNGSAGFWIETGINGAGGSTRPKIYGKW